MNTRRAPDVDDRPSRSFLNVVRMVVRMMPRPSSGKRMATGVVPLELENRCALCAKVPALV